MKRGWIAGTLEVNAPATEHEDMMMTEPDVSRWLRVERGDPSPEELAALVAVLLARTGDAAGPPAATAPAVRWRRPARAFLFDAPRVWRAYERAAA